MREITVCAQERLLTPSSQIEDCVAFRSEEPLSYKITEDSENEEEPTEITVHVQGILTAMDLLPFTKSVSQTLDLQSTIANKIS